MNKGDGKFKKGFIPWNKGLNSTDERVLKGAISSGISRKGGKMSLTTRAKMSQSRVGAKNPMFGKKRNQVTIDKIVKKRKQNGSFSHSEEWARNHSKTMSGEKNPAWKGGISNSPYGIEFNNRLKNKIKDRDGNKCRICNLQTRLCVHHIDYDKKNCHDSNLITLCSSCHSKTNFNREYWEDFIKVTILNN